MCGVATSQEVLTELKALYATKTGIPLREVARFRCGRSPRGRCPAISSPAAAPSPIALDDAIERADLPVNLMTWDGSFRR